MDDPAMKKVTELYERSGKTLDELGQAMGYAPDVARKSAWQFLKRTGDPRISMLRRFAKAVGISIQELVAETDDKSKRRKTDKHGQYRRSGDELPNSALRNPIPT